MKLLRMLGATAIVASLSLNAQAQKIKLTEGNFDVLKGQTEVAIEYAYNDMKVGRYDKEADYIKDKSADYNKKETGKGDSWAKAWVDDRSARFEPIFLSSFEESSDLKVKSSAKYTLIFHTTETEPGYNVGVTRKPAAISGEFWLVETADKSKPLAKVSVEDAKGKNFWGYDFDTGLRLAEAYEAAGKALGKFVKNKM